MILVCLVSEDSFVQTRGDMMFGGTAAIPVSLC